MKDQKEIKDEGVNECQLMRQEGALRSGRLEWKAGEESGGELYVR